MYCTLQCNVICTAQLILNITVHSVHNNALCTVQCIVYDAMYAVQLSAYALHKILYFTVN